MRVPGSARWVLESRARVASWEWSARCARHGCGRVRTRRGEPPAERGRLDPDPPRLIFVGSFTENVTMTLGAGALARPVRTVDARSLHVPWLLMLASLGVALLLAWPRQHLARGPGIRCLPLYPVFVTAVRIA